MSWLEIMAINHPFLLGLILMSITALVLSAVETIREEDEAVVVVAIILAILWFFAGIGYFLIGR